MKKAILKMIRRDNKEEKRKFNPGTTDPWIIFLFRVG